MCTTPDMEINLLKLFAMPEIELGLQISNCNIIV
jgi:hypothetical protein